MSVLEKQIQKQDSNVPNRFNNPGALPGCQAFRGFFRLEKKTISICLHNCAARNDSVAGIIYVQAHVTDIFLCLIYVNLNTN